MPQGGIKCQDNFALFLILSQMNSFISYATRDIVNNVMSGVELDYVGIPIYLDYVSSWKSCDIIQSSIKIGVFPDWCFLANTCSWAKVHACFVYLRFLYCVKHCIDSR